LHRRLSHSSAPLPKFVIRCGTLSHELLQVAKRQNRVGDSVYQAGRALYIDPALDQALRNAPLRRAEWPRERHKVETGRRMQSLDSPARNLALSLLAGMIGLVSHGGAEALE